MAEQFSTETSQPTFRAELFSPGEGISWRKIPDVLFELHSRHGCTPTVQLVALAMARITAKTGRYPSFHAKQSQLALETGFSERSITNAVRSLVALGAISARYSNGAPTTFTWNVEFLRGVERGSGVPLKDVQGYHGKWFRGTTERSSCVYIELSLELFYNSFKEFFSEDKPPYRFYVPGKRRKKGELNDAPAMGATIEVPRKEAWRDAAYHVYSKIKNRNDALSRIFLALRASNNIEDVHYPKAALLYRVTDESSIHEARKRSHIAEYLHHDDDFRQFADLKNNLIEGGNNVRN